MGRGMLSMGCWLDLAVDLDLNLDLRLDLVGLTVGTSSDGW